MSNTSSSAVFFCDPLPRLVPPKKLRISGGIAAIRLGLEGQWLIKELGTIGNGNWGRRRALEIENGGRVGGGAPAMLIT
jgi:hypothetical protein